MHDDTESTKKNSSGDQNAERHRDNPVSLLPLNVEEAISGLFKIKPKPSSGRSHKKKKEGSARA
jgi:hypothetical protein